MRKQKLRWAVLIISALLSLGTVGILFCMRNIDKQTEDTTTLYSATVETIKITDTGKHIYTEIHTKEYHAVLMISTNTTQNIDLNDIRNLQNGQRIYFRIENSKIGQMTNAADQSNNVNLINIISLETETKCIFSLEDNNKYFRIAAYPARIAGIVMALLFLSISSVNLMAIKRKW